MSLSTLASQSDLRGRYVEPKERAVAKQLDRLDKHCKAFLALSPFCTLASVGANGKVDCSPRGDMPGFVQAPDDETLLLPDRPGNNRLDSLSNIVENPEVGLLFMVPGFNETLRVNGKAEILDDPNLCARLGVDGKPARSVMRVAVREVYFHCAKAFLRSRLWEPAAQQDRKGFPSFGQILTDQTSIGNQPDTDRYLADSYKKQLW
jgi:PPOX class probable FMN-dependent enzyme